MKIVTPIETQTTTSSNSGMPGSIFLYYPILVVWSMTLFAAINRPNWDPDLVAFISLAVSIYGVVLLYVRSNRSLNFPVVYGTYLILSLLGIVAVDVLFPDGIDNFIDQVGTNILYWYTSDTWPYAVIIASLGITSFILGASILGRMRQADNSSKQITVKGFDQQGHQGVLRIGIFLLVCTALYLLIMILLGRYTLNTAYGEFHRSLGDIPGYSFFLFAYSTGITFLVATGNRQQIQRWGILYAIVSFVLLATGNRGEIFYAIAASIAIASYRGLRLNRKLIIIIMLVFFIVIPAIRQTRNIPLAERQLNDFTFNWGEPFIELGFQLRVLVTTIGWIDGGEPYANGGSYWLPVQRIIAIVIPFVEREVLEGNRFYIDHRLPTQGYSVVAEAYFNFGVVGVVAIMAGIGAYLNRGIDLSNNKRLAFQGAILAILINNIRNGFIFVPGQVIYVIVLIIIAELFIKDRYEPINFS